MAPDVRPAPHLRFSYPTLLLVRVAGSFLSGRERAFAADAAQLFGTLEPPPSVEGLDRIPATGSFVLVFNHYSSPTFPSWWGPIVISALVDRRRPLGRRGICWAMSEAWTYPDVFRRNVCTPLSRWAFRRLARVYGFVAMPPMPPRPHEVEARALAVRRLLALARRPSPPLIGLSPEGHDSPEARLMVPPSGVGRFLQQLGARGLPFLPVGLYEQGSRLIVRFGEPCRLQIPSGLPRHERDAQACSQIMLAIGRQLPPALWGAYARDLAARV